MMLKPLFFPCFASASFPVQVQHKARTGAEDTSSGRCASESKLHGLVCPNTLQGWGEERALTRVNSGQLQAAPGRERLLLESHSSQGFPELAALGRHSRSCCRCSGSLPGIGELGDSPTHPSPAVLPGRTFLSH